MANLLFRIWMEKKEMRKLTSLLTFFIIALSIFCNDLITLKKVEMKNKPPQLVFELKSGTKPKYTVNYDAYNRLIFLEIDGAKYSGKFSDNKLVGKYIEKVDMIDYGNKLGFFIKLKKDVGYKNLLGTKPYRIIFDFNVKEKKQFTVVVDPGHGGKDPGAVGFNKYLEKDIVLSVGRYLQQELGKDFKIVMTRSTDTFVTLSNRSKIANNAKADLFVSLHINSSSSSDSTGVEVFYFSKKSSPYAEKVAAFENSFGEKYGEKTGSIAQIMGELAYNKNMEKAISLAKPINNTLAERIKLKNRGIHGANFAVLRGFNGPGILVELGFINNRNDVSKLINPAYQKIMAKEIADEIRAYFN